MGIDKETLKNKVVNLLKQYSLSNESAIAIAIDGEWGVGKSYMYHKIIEEEIKKELNITPIYTSVFGKKDENEIIKDLVSQFLTIENKNADTIRDFIEGTFKFFGKNIDVDSLFKFFKKEHMSNTIVCIDDFERLSDKIPVQDVLGLISELKENKGCHVILLYNSSKININSQEQFNNYIEKIIDITYNYTPNPCDQLELLKGLLKYPLYTEKFPQEEVEKYLSNIKIKDKINELELTNLREIKKIIYCFNEYFEGLDNEYLKDEYTRVLFVNIIFYCIVNAKLVIKLEDELSTISQKDTDSISKIKNELRLCGMKEDPKNGILNFKPIDENFIRSFVKVIIKYQKNNFFNFRSSNQFEDKIYVKSEEELISKLFELAQEYKNKNKISGEDNE
ncbi:P-loop NTPase fold protein [Campylobacter jejuni]|uniref:P-loop NTPase fold protein n=1 Tax=Campylobacter jejuni TaxID=197 RepID=UPI003B9CC86C